MSLNYTLKTIVVGPFEVNCYVLTIAQETFIVDPGFEPEKIISYLEKNSLTPSWILLTHAHFDHISGVKELVDKYKIPVYLHEKDIIIYYNSGNSMVPFYPPLSNLAKTVNKIDNQLIEVIHTPGHSPGGTCFYIKDYDLLFSGDSIFLESIGRTDLPGGNHKQLIEFIKTKILSLPDKTIIYPGHGDKTTVLHEKSYNPWFS